MPEGEVLKLKRLRKALTLARLDFDSVIEKCRAGECQFHEVESACAITALTVSGPYKTCFIIASAGNIKGELALVAKIEAFARASGCSAIEGDARFGWERAIDVKATGFKPILTKYRKILE